MPKHLVDVELLLFTRHQDIKFKMLLVSKNFSIVKTSNVAVPMNIKIKLKCSKATNERSQDSNRNRNWTQRMQKKKKQKKWGFLKKRNWTYFMYTEIGHTACLNAMFLHAMNKILRQTDQSSTVVTSCNTKTHYIYVFVCF